MYVRKGVVPKGCTWKPQMV